MLLAGVLLKLGTYGFLRLCLPLAPDASLSVGVPLIGTLAVIGIIYGAFCAWPRTTSRSWSPTARSATWASACSACSPSTTTGMTGSLLQMINHGLSTGGLFLLVGMLYERYHTRKMADYGGMAAAAEAAGRSSWSSPV